MADRVLLQWSASSKVLALSTLTTKMFSSWKIRIPGPHMPISCLLITRRGSGSLMPKMRMTFSRTMTRCHKISLNSWYSSIKTGRKCLTTHSILLVIAMVAFMRLSSLGNCINITCRLLLPHRTKWSTRWQVLSSLMEVQTGTMTSFVRTPLWPMLLLASIPNIC